MNKSDQQQDSPDSCNTESIRVYLWAAKIPVLGFIADHHWFVIERDGFKSRWEVWQKPNACNIKPAVPSATEHSSLKNKPERCSWGHLNLNLLPPTVGVGNGDATLHTQWSGALAQNLATRIEKSPQTYPWCNRYWYWPGPNSNTYVQWVLMGQHSLGHRALGKQYCHLFA
jgi:hypothetical protein